MVIAKIHCSIEHEIQTLPVQCKESLCGRTHHLLVPTIMPSELHPPAVRNAAATHPWCASWLCPFDTLTTFRPAAYAAEHRRCQPTNSVSACACTLFLGCTFCARGSPSSSWGALIPPMPMANFPGPARARISHTIRAATMRIGPKRLIVLDRVALAPLVRRYK